MLELTRKQKYLLELWIWDNSRNAQRAIRIGCSSRASMYARNSATWAFELHPELREIV